MTQKNTNTQPKLRRVRGTGIYEGDEFSFKPFEEGESTQRNVKSCRGGKTYETTSEKDPLKVAHLTCPANAADPYSEYTGQLERLGIKPMQPMQMPDSQRLVNEGGMTVYLDTKQNSIIFQGAINLTKCLNWQSEVMRQLQIIVRTLPACDKFKKVINKIKKGGIK